MSHLNRAWATADHINTARRLFEQHNSTVASLAGGFGATPAEFEAACRLAVALDAPVLGGSAPVLSDGRDAVVSLLDRYDLTLGIENHPGLLMPSDVLAAIGDGGNGRIGATIDTGWYGTAGYDAVKAIEDIGEQHIVHVHLKDVITPGGHVTCRYGRGCVPVKDCVQTLKRIGYTGAISIEHEPEEADPTEDCRASLDLVRRWIESAS